MRILQYSMTSCIGLVLLAILSIGASADINLLSNDPLIEAVKADDLKGAEEMLQRQHDVDVRDENGQTALFFAAIRGNEDFVEMLLRFNPKIGAVDKFGSSPLYYAAAANNVGVIEILSEKGADLDQPNRQGLTPLMVAASEGHLDAVRVLVELKSDIAITDFTGRTAYDWAVRNKRQVVIRYLKSLGLGS
jgi:ankyrin repeat protein